jgi:hypothetical protein
LFLCCAQAEQVREEVLALAVTEQDPAVLELYLRAGTLTCHPLSLVVSSACVLVWLQLLHAHGLQPRADCLHGLFARVVEQV